MKTWVTAGVVAAVLVAMGLPVLAVAVGGGAHAPAAPAAFADDQPTGAPEEGDEAEKPDPVHEDHARGQRHGPPPWAHADRAGKTAKGSLDAWKRLTPAEKAKRMAVLAQRHAAGMRRWADCVASGRTDCERPRPPGLAKRLR